MVPCADANPRSIAIAVVEWESQFLVGVRGPAGPLAGYHEFPGGKVESGEAPAVAAQRECQEETGIAIGVGELLLDTSFEYPHGWLRFFFFAARPSEVPPPPPWGRFEWLSREQLRCCHFPPANRPLLDILLSELI